MDSQSAAKLPFNLKIVPTDKDGIPAGMPFVAMFNPESFAIHEEVAWDSATAHGTSGGDPKFKRIKPRRFTLDFTLDGTGVSTGGTKIPVTAQVALFRAVTTNVRGAIHRPSYLLVQYGTFICNCVLESSDVTYTMFDMAGLPIRAKVSARFTERVVGGLNDVVGMLSSPDLTHRVEVRDGDILPLLTHRVYNNPHYYLQVARVNRLKNFRRLSAGTMLVFPPIAKR